MTLSTRAAIAAVLIGCAVGLSPVLAQQRPTFASRVDAVRIDVLVTDRGRPVPGLTAADFELSDNGVAQTAALVSSDTTPLNVFVAFDTSSSLSADGLASFGTAARALLSSLRPADRVSLMTFNHRVTLQSPLTHDPAQLTAKLNTVTPAGGTALFDATFLAISLRESDLGRALLMLFSDGEDTASWLTERKVLNAAQRSDIVAYPVAPYDARRHAAGPWVDPFTRGFMDALIKDTGGRVLEADPGGDLQKTFTDILTEFENRYLLSYVPAGVPSSGWHDVTVKLKSRRGTVIARRGYFASNK